MADKITTYSEQTARNILARLDRLEMRQNALLSGGLTQSFPQGVLPTRWARTCTSPESPTYPTAGNVVAVEFGDCDPSPLSAGSTAIKTFTAYDPQVSVLATGDNSPLPFQGQIVPVVWRNGKWWYLHPNFRRATADSSISAGSSGQVSLFDDTTDMGSRTAYYTWGDSGGATINSGDEIFVAWFDAEQKWIILPGSVGNESPFYVRNEYSNLTVGRGLELGQLHAAGVVKADIRTDCSRAYAILAEDINNNTIGKAKVSGFATARVNVLKTAHTHCYLPRSETVFKTGFGGPLELCQTPTTTGAQDLLVRWQPLYRRRILTAATLLANNFGDCNFYGTWGINTVLGNDDVYFAWMKGGVASITYGVEGWATWDDGTCVWLLDSAECSA